METSTTPPIALMVRFGEQNPHTKDMLGEGDEESEVKGLTMTPDVQNPSPEGFSTTSFPHISPLPFSPTLSPPTLQFPHYPILPQAAAPAPLAPTGRHEDPILQFIQ